MDQTVLQTSLPFPRRSGKVRDVYEVGTVEWQGTGVDALLIVATDRISAFDCVMPNGIPGKGKILTQISNFWFEFLHQQAEIEHHLLASDPDQFPKALREHAHALDGRAVLVRKTRVVPIECVVRGYLAGSAWQSYRAGRSVSGIVLPSGLTQCQKLPAPIFTPTTKEQSGHDQEISQDEVRTKVGDELAGKLRGTAIDLYEIASRHALERGVIIADTKFEFGLDASGRLLLIDEALTPDSSRFWPLDQYAPGRDQPSFDKQFVRDYLSTLAWDRTPPAPALPEVVVEGTRRRYLEALTKLTGPQA